MYNFEYKNPVKILFGKGQISGIREEVPYDSKILMIAGSGSIRTNGVYEQVTRALEGFDISEFWGIEPNPLYETCMKAVKYIKDNQIEFLLSVGGGSVLDATKFIAAAACWHAGDPWNILTGRIKVKEALPLGAVLTLPATGSEMNGNSVISRQSTVEKFAFSSESVMPRFSVLDPECVFSLPDRQVANGIVDAFVHVMEQYLTFNVNSPLQDRMAEGIITTLIEEGPKVMANRTDYDAAANFMWCATLALNGLIAAGVPEDWATHQIGHELTALHGIDHGRTLAIVFPGVMNIRMIWKKEKILQYGQRIWNINSGSEIERIDAAIKRTVDFFESLGISTKLSAYGVSQDSVEEIAERFRIRKSRLGEHDDIDAEEITLILEDRL